MPNSNMDASSEERVWKRREKGTRGVRKRSVVVTPSGWPNETSLEPVFLPHIVPENSPPTNRQRHCDSSEPRHEKHVCEARRGSASSPNWVVR